jgi:hypothetical protein
MSILVILKEFGHISTTHTVLEKVLPMDLLSLEIRKQGRQRYQPLTQLQNI